MKYFPHIFITLLLITIGLVIYKNKTQYNHKQDYTLDVYTDTIYDYVIVTTVANNGNNISISSIIVDDIYDFSNNN